MVACCLKRYGCGNWLVGGTSKSRGPKRLPDGRCTMAMYLCVGPEEKGE